MSLFFQGWDVFFLGWEGQVVPPAQSIPQGGAGYPVYGKRKYVKRIDQLVGEWIDASLREHYEEIVAIAPKAVKREAAKVVKPFAETKARIPQPEAIDWPALERDAERVRRLLQIWADEIANAEAEDELLLMS